MADSKPPADDKAPSDPATEELVAYLDGELSPPDAESLATRLGLDPKLRAQAESLQRTWDILDILPQPQPSASFASRTVSQMLVVPAAGGNVQSILAAPANSALAASPLQRSGASFWLASFLTIAAAGFGGYFAHQAYAPAAKLAVMEVPTEDVPLMKNLRLYRNVDDMEYLKQLDSPMLFADPAES